MYLIRMKTTIPDRNISLDILRVIACYLVIQVHAGEPFYIGEAGKVIAGENAHWVNILNSIGRAAVPLFIMITGYFLLPIKESTSQFFRKRFTRVLIPFVIWCVIYAFYQFFTGAVDLKGAFLNILKIGVNYGTEIGHLWYIYMLIGLYLFAPIISPWIKSASRRSIEFFLCLWSVSLCLPYIHLLFPEVWGECYWNSTPMLYYFTGFLGYAVLGSYAKSYWSKPSKWDVPAGLALLIVGYAITYAGFSRLLDSTEYVRDLELTWAYDTVNVAMMGAGLFLLTKNIRVRSAALGKIITDVSLKSYGIYLLHIIVLTTSQPFINELLPVAKYSIIPTSLVTLIVSYGIIKLISYLPKSKYIIG